MRLVQGLRRRVEDLVASPVQGSGSPTYEFGGQSQVGPADQEAEPHEGALMVTGHRERAFKRRVILEVRQSLQVAAEQIRLQRVFEQTPADVLSVSAPPEPFQSLDTQRLPLPVQPWRSAGRGR